eukprot:gene18650-26365_t
MEEIFKPCIENYEISNFGNCRRKMCTGNYKITAGSILNTGYRIKDEIPQDDPDRKSKVLQLYRKNNAEKLKEKKKLYYNKNKNVILQNAKNDKIEVVCESCLKTRSVTKTSVRVTKNHGKLCSSCSSRKNLGFL